MRSSSSRLAFAGLHLAGLVAAPALAWGQSFARTGAAEVLFTGKGPAGFKLEGKSKELTVEVDGAALVITVPLDPVDTGISLRNRHMREKYLETKKYPNAQLRVPRSALALPEPGKEVRGQATGTMSLHGQAREQIFTYVVRRDGDLYLVEGDLGLDMRDFGIAEPGYLGITVKPNVKVHVAFSAKESK